MQQCLVAALVLHYIANGHSSPTTRLSVAVVIQHQRPLLSHTVGVSKDILVHVAIWGDKVIQPEVLHFGEERAAVQQREDLPLMTLHQVLVGHLIPIGATILHAVLLGVAFHLPMSKHRQPRQSCHQRADTKVFVTLAELIHGSALVGIVHEVHITFENLRIEVQRVLDQLTVFGIFLIAHHIHKCTVVHTMHAQCADEIAFHQPERFGQQQCVRRFLRHAIHNFSPEFLRHRRVEVGLRHPKVRAGSNVATGPRLREPEALVVLLGQRHRRVKADDGRTPRHAQDRLDHSLAHVRIEVVELRRVIPGHARAIVAVIDVARVASPVIDAFEHHSSIGAIIVMILEVNAHARVAAQIYTVEGIAGERAVR